LRWTGSISETESASALTTYTLDPSGLTAMDDECVATGPAPVPPPPPLEDDPELELDCDVEPEPELELELELGLEDGELEQAMNAAIGTARNTAALASRRFMLTPISRS
jgi:hypothetical protein